MTRATFLASALAAACALAAAASPAGASPVEQSRRLGEAEAVDFPAKIPQAAFLSSGMADAFEMRGKPIEAHGFALRRLDAGQRAIYEKNGWLCLDNRQRRGFVCYGLDPIESDRAWMLQTAYKDGRLPQSAARSLASLYQLDCNYLAVRTLRLYETDGHFGAGSGLSKPPRTEDAEWRFPRKESAEDLLLQAVCRNQSLLPTQGSAAPWMPNQIAIPSSMR